MIYDPAIELASSHATNRGMNSISSLSFSLSLQVCFASAAAVAPSLPEPAAISCYKSLLLHLIRGLGHFFRLDRPGESRRMSPVIFFFLYLLGSNTLHVDTSVSYVATMMKIAHNRN